MGKHMRYLMITVVLITVLLAVSCATTGDAKSLTGVWDSEEDGFSCRMMFTADG